MKTDDDRNILTSLLDYDPSTGIFTWRRRDRSMFSSLREHERWNSRYAGKRAGTVSDNGNGFKLRRIGFNGRSHKEHQLAWLIMMPGAPLPDEIDHKNRDATDNRWENLRGSCRSDNQHNRSRNINNTSGVTGVNYSIRTGKWMARVTVGGDTQYLGLFAEIDEAAMEVMEFRAENGFSPSHGLHIAPYHRHSAALEAS